MWQLPGQHMGQKALFVSPAGLPRNPSSGESGLYWQYRSHWSRDPFTTLKIPQSSSFHTFDSLL